MHGKPANELRQVVGVTELVMFGAGTAIGSAIFTVLQPAAQIGGAAVLWGVGLAAAPMVVFGIVYAYLASAIPRTAASYEWQREFTSPLFAYLIGWARIAANIAAMTMLAQTLVNYASMAFPIPPKLTIFAIFTFLFGLNYFGVIIAGRAQTIMMLGLLGLLAVFVGSAVPHLHYDIIASASSAGWWHTLAVVPLMINLFLGIEASTELGGETKNAQIAVPLGLILAMLLTVTVYFLVTFAALSLIGPAGLAASKAPLLTAAAVTLGPVAKPLIIAAAILSLMKSMNATFIVFSRFLYAMARQSVLPTALAAVHPRWRTPHQAIIATFLLTCTGLLLPANLLFLLLAMNIPVLMKYMGTCIAGYRVARFHPEVHAKAVLKFRPATIQILAAAGAVLAVAIALLGITADWQPYALLAAWTAIGLGYYFWPGRRAAPASTSTLQSDGSQA